jgi:hypothetical protein
MSSYSDWKCGALTDEQYEQECNEEYRREQAWLDEREKEGADNE